MRKFLRYFILVVLALLLVYLLGPKPDDAVLSTTMPQVPDEPRALESFIAQLDAPHKIKPDNQARIVWANDSSKEKTPYALVYVHGFSACQEEGNPVHRAMAKRFGANLFLCRLAEHGIDTTEQLQNLTADKLWESAKLALAVGKKIGHKVILMGTSTGGTLALKLAADFPELVDGLVLYSPNIAINDPNAWVVNNHWGLELARLVKGSNYNTPPDSRPIYSAYWNRPYRLEAVVALQELLERTMDHSTFAKVTDPVLTLYYYKSETEQDPVVKVSAMLDMMKNLGTPEAQKRAMAMPLTGDHVLASPIRSHDVPGVQRETEKFMTEIIGLN